MRRGVCTRYEGKKLLTAQHGIWIIAAAVCVQLLLCLTAKFHAYEYPFDTNAYRIYAERYAGAYSEETAAQIAAELAAQIEIANTPMPENLTAEDYAEYRSAVMLAQSKCAVLQAISERYQNLRDTGGALCYDLELRDLIARYAVNWCSLLCIAVLTVKIMLSDSLCGMVQLLYPTKAGRRRILAAKLVTVALLSAAMTGICLALQWGILSARWQLGDWEQPVQSVQILSGCALPVCIRQAVWLSAVMQLFGAVAAAILTALCASLLEREIPAIAAAVMLIGIGAVLAGEYPQAMPLLLWFPLSGLRAFADCSGGQIAVAAGCMLLRFLTVCCCILRRKAA